jgi:hypothetical protein
LPVTAVPPPPSVLRENEAGRLRLCVLVVVAVWWSPHGFVILLLLRGPGQIVVRP